MYVVRVTKRRRRRIAGTREARQTVTKQRVAVHQASVVVRLAYTRAQAAEALGISRSTFIRRVLPFIETVELAGGSRLVPVDELERLLAERRRAPSRRAPEPRQVGRPPRVPPDVVERIRAARAEGQSLAGIARSLTDEGVRTAQGGPAGGPQRYGLYCTASIDVRSAESEGKRLLDRRERQLDPVRR
jgi:hypothetical protein